MIILQGKRALLYRRVSTTDQKDFGNSLSEQKHRLREFCDQNSIFIDKEFEEDYSAKDFNRPEFARLLQYATKNPKRVDYLFIHKWDRFSRNALEALQIIRVFKAMNIEVNSVDQWINHEDANQFVMLLLHLGMPEVENKIRSERVIDGSRRALKEGRWINRQPKGYIPGKDEYGRTLMKPDPEFAPLVTSLFNDFAMGISSQNELLKSPKFEKLRLSKSTLSRMLKQIAYAGKIKIPGYKSEPEIIVTALHQQLITMQTFNEVQIQLSSRSRYKQKPKKLNPILPLRGFLKCSKCGSNLTGSGSTSKTGKKHYYYHCDSKKKCGKRVRIKDMHDAFEKILNGIQPDSEVCELFELILQEKYKTSEISNYDQIKKLDADIVKEELMLEKLTRKLLEEVIGDETYKEYKKKISDRLSELEQQKRNLNVSQKDVREYLSFGVYLIKNIKELYIEASIITKQKILSSILEEKLIFEDEKYRTPVFSEGFQYIYQSTKDLGRIKLRSENNSVNVSRIVPGVGLEPTRP